MKTKTETIIRLDISAFFCIHGAFKYHFTLLNATNVNLKMNRNCEAAVTENFSTAGRIFSTADRTKANKKTPLNVDLVPDCKGHIILYPKRRYIREFLLP